MSRAARLVILALSMFLTGATPEYKVDWGALEQAVSVYIERPDQSAAGDIVRLLPPGIADRHVGVFDVAAAERIFQQLDALDALVKSGHPEAVDVAFALIAISDGHFTETLLTIIASSIDIAPVTFLTALKNNRDRPFASCEVAFDTGLDYVDDPKSELRVLERRLAKVQQVHDRGLGQQKLCVTRALSDTIAAMKKNMR